MAEFCPIDAVHCTGKTHMAVVYVIGAGASCGECLHLCPGPQTTIYPNPPLARGFFDGDLWGALGYAPDQVERNFGEAFEYIRRTRPTLPAEAGSASWKELDLENLLTSIELEREFRNAGSDETGFLLRAHNKMVRFTWRILALCTVQRYGEFTQELVRSLAVNDSIITFNWDLLIDMEFSPFVGADHPQHHYNNFFALALRDPSVRMIAGPPGAQGLFLKLHGSLNWLFCANEKCPAHSEIQLDRSIESSLNRAMGIHVWDETCQRCGSTTMPLLIPPLLRKPITENWIIRSAWGLARQRLLSADVIVIIGFSAAPTDFYATWLLHSTTEHRAPAVIVVNPENDPKSAGHAGFKGRMKGVFPRGYNSAFTRFSEIKGIIENARVWEDKIQRANN